MKPREKELISIIVPVYNSQRFLERCIRSLIHQSYNHIEILLVDDGSYDSSLQICDEFAKNDKRIRVFHQENGGAAKARNTGIDASIGEYIMFIDSDDYVEADLCEQLYMNIVQTDANCVVCGYTIEDETGAIREKNVVSESVVIGGAKALKEQFCNGKSNVRLVEPWSKLFKYNMWQELRFSEGFYYEDLEVMPRLYYNCEKISAIPYIGYHYLIHDNSASHGKGTDNKRVTDSILIRERHLDFFDKKNEKEISDCIISRLLDLILTSAKNDWIPKDERERIFRLYRKYWNRYKYNKSLSVHMRIRYELFALFGEKAFIGRLRRN